MTELNTVSIELHTHTNHSDGHFRPEDLLENVIKEGYHGFAITDHNTYSAYEYLMSFEQLHDLPLLRGIEWTTFFGHVLILNGSCDVPWFELTQFNADQLFKKLKELGAIIGIAHPRNIGSPICTGCRFELDIKDWNNITFIEIWNGENPESNSFNELNYHFYIELLQRGHKLSPSCGRDWHGLNANEVTTGVTYLVVEDSVNPSSIIDAIAKQRMIASLGVNIEVTLIQNGHDFQIGETIKPGKCHLSIILKERHKSLGIFEVFPEFVRIYDSDEKFLDIEIKRSSLMTEIIASSKYVRVELFGIYKGKKNQRIAVCTPFFVS